jgi:hypothetical protein
MVGVAKMQTNIMTQNFSYGINGYDVNSSVNDNNNNVTCRVVHATNKTGSSSDDWIY